MKQKVGQDRIVTSGTQLLVALVGLLFVYLQYINGTEARNPVIMAVFFLFATTILVDRIGQIALSISSKKDDENLRSMIDQLPSNFVGRNDIVTFLTEAQASAYCVAMIPHSIHIRNTVLRYDNERRPSRDTSDFDGAWRDAKVAAMNSGDCTVTEIISHHIPKELYQRHVVSKVDPNKQSQHQLKILDEDRHPMLQMIIMETGQGHKEVIFGWRFPGILQGTSFMTRNDRVVSYFEDYFQHFYDRLASDDPARSS